MRKNFLSFLSILLCIMLCFTSCGGQKESSNPSSSNSPNKNAVESSEYSPLSDFTFSKKNDHAVVIEYLGNDADVIIPSTFEGLPVTVINPAAFKNCSSLVSVTIPDSITTIRENAFHSCSNLTNIQLGNSIHTVEADAFCQTGLTELFIPKTITDMGNCAFSQNVSLTSLKIEDGLETIGRSAFSYSLALESVTIPASVNKIEEYAFSGCKLLKSVTFLGNAPITLEEHIFKNASKDFVIYYHQGTTGWDSSAFADYTLRIIE